jgi:3'-5' exoribonuclease
MKSPYVNELQPNQTFTGQFLVQFKDIRQKKTGDPYLSLILADKTGELDSKMWDNAAEVMDTFEREDFVRVKGQLQIFQNRPQLTIHKLQRIDAAEVDFADYFPSSKRDRDEMYAELMSHMGGIEDPHIKALLESFFADAQIAAAYKVAPAAKSVHHAYLGGLIEHVLSLIQLAKFTCSHYPNMDRDLVIAGVILHDIGKIRELDYTRVFQYSTEGQLLGHIVIGYQMLREKLAAIPDFPPKKRLLLEHLLISHHGEIEYGSPRTPAFPEALLLHLLDNLDAKMATMAAMLEKDPQIDGEWTGYNSVLERSALKKQRYLDGPAPKQAAASATATNGQRPSGPQQNKPSSVSAFGEKLQGALGKPGN